MFPIHMAALYTCEVAGSRNCGDKRQRASGMRSYAKENLKIVIE